MTDPLGRPLELIGPAALTEGVLVADSAGVVTAVDRAFLGHWRLPHDTDLGELRLLVELLLAKVREPETVREAFFDPELDPGQEFAGTIEMADGRKLEMKLRQSSSGQRVNGRIWSVRDASEQQKIEQSILQAEKMAAIGRLVGGISHDFNNLLTVIRGYCDLSMERLKAVYPPIPRLRESVTEISKAAERAASLTGQLLAYCRQQIVSPRVIDINDELRDLEKMLLRLVGDGFRLQLLLEADPATVSADRAQIQQLVMNLVINARDAMPEGGTITLKTESFTIDSSFAARFDYPVEVGPQVMVRVRDTGVGIAPELLDRIFEPFFTTKEVGRGTGLGLSTVYGIAKQSGGYIWVDSHPGTGTEFQICLPRVLGDAKSEADRPAAEKSKPKGESILVVDDQEQVREVMVHLLTDAGYRVRSVALPRQALELQREGELFDLLITDLITPEMDGSQLAQHMAARQSGLAVLYTSAYHPDAYKRRGVLPADAEVLAKPLDAGALRQKVGEVLG